jgi:hypothetical protein
MEPGVVYILGVHMECIQYLKISGQEYYHLKYNELSYTKQSQAVLLEK